MASAEANMAAFESALSMEDVEYAELDDAAIPTVVMHFRTECVSKVDVLFSFDREDNTFRCCTGPVATVPSQRRSLALHAINEMNGTYRWFNFYLTNDGEVQAQSDAILVDDHVGDMCMTYLANLLKIVDDAYPRLMSGIWSV